VSLRVTEYAIQDDADGGVIKIRRDNGSNTVTFPCGEYRRFSDDDLSHVLACIDALADAPDVWLTLTDGDARSFSVRTAAGNLYMEQSIPYLRADDTEGQRSAPVDDLKKAFRKLANGDQKEPTAE